MGRCGRRASGGWRGVALDAWVGRVRDALGIEEEPDIVAVLKVAREVAHGIERKAAPVTTYLMGYAAGRSGLGSSETARRVLQLLGPGTEDAVERP